MHNGAAIAAAAIFFASAIGAVGAVAGVSTFNDFTTQTTVACSGFPPTNSQGNAIFAAAMSDLSPLWVGARCEGTMDASKCNGQGSCVDCVGPACPDEELCGTCFNVRCTDSLDGEVTGACTNNVIKVKIVDACPATHPANYCKIPEFGGNIRPIEACEQPNTNAMDIAVTARSLLSTFQGNLNIDIEATSC
uniref:Cell surface hydrophobicity-associated protein n=1 Tax=Ganoderma boninense TaxID=34458 RepID=A0A5K1K3T9_9APHY